MKDTLCPVLYQTSVGAGYYKLGLETGWTGFVPGQFGMLQVPRESGVLLRRPFSFARQEGAQTEILYKVVGRGTQALQRVAVGAKLSLLGPLGHGFSLPAGEGDLVGVAGGYGVAPFLELAFQLAQQAKTLRLFYGARSKEDLIYIQEFKALNVKLHLSTVDGSVGHQGFITELLSQVYGEQKPAVLWACGPMGLLKAVSQWAEPRNILCQVSVEETMGCGTGVCLGCVVQDAKGHFIRACVEGPVFESKAIRL